MVVMLREIPSLKRFPCHTLAQTALCTAIYYLTLRISQAQTLLIFWQETVGIMSSMEGQGMTLCTEGRAVVMT